MTQETKQRKEKERAEEVEGEEEEKEKRRRSTCSRERRRLRQSMGRAPAVDRRDKAEQWKGFPNRKNRKGDGRWRLVWERDMKRFFSKELWETIEREEERKGRVQFLRVSGPTQWCLKIYPSFGTHAAKWASEGMQMRGTRRKIRDLHLARVWGIESTTNFCFYYMVRIRKSIYKFQKPN